MKGASLKPLQLNNLFDKVRSLIKFLPFLPLFMKYSNISLQQFASRFKDPFLREAVCFFIDAPGWPMLDFPLIAMIGFIKSSVTKAGAPLGGSQKVAFHIANLFKQLGGEINYNSRVKGLIIENDRVRGIKLEEGTAHSADYLSWGAVG